MANRDIEKARAYSRAWYQRNREHELIRGRERSRAYRAANPELARAQTRASIKRQHVTIKGRSRKLLDAAKKRAAVKALPFDLTLDWVMERMGKPCEATGLTFILEPGRGAGLRSAFCPSIDRRVPAAGYVKSNCRLIVWGLNAALSTWGEADFKVIALAFLRAS